MKKKILAEKHETGKKGEQLAVAFLEHKGLVILETNCRYSRAEIDIIAKQEEVLVFIEVKTRTGKQIAPPEASVTRKKRELMAAAASAYMDEIGHDWEIRFDIVTILLHSNQQYKITHFVDAFFPGW